jgi:RNA polymerase sigma-70 factor (ECF subfamily)
MEPSTRPYNPNRQRASRARGGDSAKLQAPTPEPKGSGATPASRGGKSRSRRASEKRVAAVATPESAPTALEPLMVSGDVATAVQPPHDEAIAETPDVGHNVALDEPGPLVGVDDFEDLFTRFQTPITNFIYRLVGNREQAYDLAQDVFVKAYRALSGGATIQAGALSSWLYRIASNTATDALRRRRLISWLPLSLFNDDRGVGAGMPGSDNGFSQQTFSEEHLASAMGAFTSGYDGGRFEQRVADREIVERVLQRLPEKYAACLLLYEHEGFSCAEIAEVLHVTPSAVKMRLMRARERFISIYQQEMEGRR